jgi:flavin reductase (DIM6/NTAB) family NADH-FMN oxidoreductase RutF
MDIEDFKACFRQLASGVCVVTFRRDTGLHGFTATSVTSVSMSPPMALFCVAQRNESHRHLQTGTWIGISILEASQRNLSAQFAGKAGPSGYGDVDTVCLGSGVPLIAGALGHLEGTVSQMIATGDHSVVLCELAAAQVKTGRSPLLYYKQSYHDLVTL